MQRTGAPSSLRLLLAAAVVSAAGGSIGLFAQPLSATMPTPGISTAQTSGRGNSQLPPSPSRTGARASGSHAPASSGSRSGRSWLPSAGELPTPVPPPHPLVSRHSAHGSPSAANGGLRSGSPSPAGGGKAPVATGAGGIPDRVGYASWYGPHFHGRLTASGEVYNMNDLTAANRTLPFGTKVRVTDLSTGRSVDVTINDRGPFVAGRIIDLSRAAARAIGLTAQGVAKVRLHVLKVGNNRRVPGPPALEAAARAREARRRAAAAKSPPARVETLAAASNFMPTAGGTTPAAGGASGKPANPVVVVQVGSFHDLANAVRLRNLLAQDGFDPIYEKWHSYTRVVLVSVPLAHLPTVRKRLDRVGITSILVRRN